MKSLNNHNLNISTTDKFTPSVVWLETEDFEKAYSNSEINLNKIKEMNQWQMYLNTLALLGFKKYLKQRNPDIKINDDNKNRAFDNISYLQVDSFSICLIILDSVDELIPIPTELTTSYQSAHFYVLIEVLEEEEQLKIHGFLRHDELSKFVEKQNLEHSLEPSSDSYQLPLSLFDPELNNLLLYTRFLSSTAIELPVPTNNNIVEALATSTQTALINLSEWWNGAIEEGWQFTESILKGNSNNLAWGNVRSTKEVNTFSLSQTKLYDSGILLQNKAVALVISVKEEDEQKGVLVQIVSHQEECLPPGLKLKVTLNPYTAPDSQEVIARADDEIIQLEFSEAPGKQFEVEVSYCNTIVREGFIL